MIIYVVDNNVFSHTLNNFSFDVFKDIWEPWGDFLYSGKIISVDEVYHELFRHYGEKEDKGKWLKNYRSSFLKPSNDEGKIIASIFQSNKFCEGIKERSIRNGTPEADAMLVAKAKVVGGVIVTAEADDKPNSEKIPNICVAYGVPYIKKDEFYRMLRNVHSNNSETAGVTIQYELSKPVSLIESELDEWKNTH